MMMYYYVSGKWNIIMKQMHIKIMKHILPSLNFLILLFPFQWVQFFENEIYLIAFFFLIYTFMIQLYYHVNEKKTEAKDFIFTMIFMVLIFLILRLFQIHLDWNQFLIIGMAACISIVLLADNIRLSR